MTGTPDETTTPASAARHDGPAGDLGSGLAQELARALFSAPFDLVVLLDTVGHVIDVNDTMAARLGRPRAALVGVHMRDLLPAAVARGRAERFARVVETGLRGFNGATQLGEPDAEAPMVIAELLRHRRLDTCKRRQNLLLFGIHVRDQP